MIMSMEDEVTRLRTLVETAHTELPKIRLMVDELIAQKRRYRELLEQVHALDMGHSHECDCDRCEAWRAIDKELTQ